MKKKKIWKLMSAFTTGEAQKFHKWLEGDLNGKKWQLLIISQKLTENFPKAPREEEILEALTEIDSKSTNQYRKYLSQLANYVEEYLAFTALRQGSNHYAKQLLLLRELNSRKKPEAFEEVSRDFENELNKTAKNGKSCRAKYEFELERRIHLLKTLRKHQSENLTSLIQFYDRWWIHEKMRLICVKAINSRIFHASDTPGIPDKLIRQYAKRIFDQSEDPVLKIYHDLYTAITEETDDNLLGAISSDFIKYRSFFEKNAEKDCFFIIQNLLIDKYNQEGNKKIGEKLLEIIVLGLESRLLYQEKYLPAFAYKNVILICIRLYKNKLAEEFLNSYLNDLAPQDKDDIFRFCSLFIAFSNGAYEAVMKNLSRGTFRNQTYHIQARYLFAQSLYEMNPSDEEEVLKILSTLEKYLRRAGISDGKKQEHRTRIRFFKSLIRAFNEEELTKLQAEIEKSPTREHQLTNWFIEKIQHKLLQKK